MSSVSLSLSVRMSVNVMRGLENMCELMSKEVVEMLASKFGFSVEEGLRELGMVKVVKEIVEKKEKKEKSKYTLPFNGTMSAECCKGVKFNNGLFTQCESKGEEYCGNCAKQAEKNSSGEPDCGRIEARVATGLYDYKDPKGRSPLSFAKYMQQKGWSQEEIVTEASRQNTEINAEHFVIQEEKKGGRPKKEQVEKPVKVVKPKKSSKVVEAEPELADLFATLVAEAAALSVDDEDESVGSTDSKKTKLAEEKAAKAQALAEEKAAKAQALAEEKAVKAQALAEEKAVKAQALAEEKAVKAAKLAEEKSAKEAKLAEEKEAKTAKVAEEKEAKAAKALQLQAEKDAKSQALAEEKAAKAAAKLAEKKKPSTSATVSEPVEEQVKISAKKFEHNGKKYAKDQNGIVYDRATCEAIGKWDEEKQDIILDPVDDDVVETEDELEEEAESVTDEE